MENVLNVMAVKFNTDDDKKVPRWKKGDVGIMFMKPEQDDTYRVYCMTGFCFIPVTQLINVTEHLPQGERLLDTKDLCDELEMLGLNICISHYEGVPYE